MDIHSAETRSSLLGDLDHRRSEHKPDPHPSKTLDQGLEAMTRTMILAFQQNEERD